MKTKPALIVLLIGVIWPAALVLPAFGASPGVFFITLHSFQGLIHGANPQAGLVQGSDGNFYGTAYGGGTNGGYGTVFKINTNGALTSLYSFTGGNDGANPEAGLVQGSDGNFYGTTQYGGTNSFGTVFKINTNGALTSLYSFTGTNDGRTPNGLVQGSDGNFYGTTSGGGTNYAGTVFKINTNGALTSLYSFTGTNDGGSPNGLVQGSDGNFYGTTKYGGGTNDSGIVFKISANGVLTNLYSFTGGNDGWSPNGLVQGSDGYFYGTTEYGGTNYAGTVFKINTNGTLTSLYSFGTIQNLDGDALDGANPEAGLVQGSDGYFYGTTSGFGWSGDGYGTVFKIDTIGVLTNLYSFTGSDDGWSPNGLVQGSDGNFYGTAYEGGTNGGYGTVFKINTNGALTSLYSFPGGNDGAYPEAGLVQSSDGYFYGTTSGFGPSGDGYGTVFKINTNGGLANLASFDNNNGANPQAGLVQGSDGNFYGTAYGGGTNGWGTVFKINANGALISLYSFTGGNDGAYPEAGLVQGSDGNFYGTAYGGGTNGWGTVFKINTNGTLTSLYSFTGTNDGGFPNGLVQGSDGYFYGTTSGYNSIISTWPPCYSCPSSFGTVFKISANGVLINSYSFAYDDGWSPNGLVQGSDGYFYGTTFGGGTNDSGTVFKINTDGALTSLYSFTGGNDGAGPLAGLLQGSDGNFYGTTSGGGTNDSGTVFKINTDGALTSLYSFTGTDDGAYPVAGLVQGRDGNFYGATEYGGTNGNGTLFRLTVVPPSPELTIIHSGPNVILTWLTYYNGFSYAGYTLQSTTNLVSPTVWTSVSPGPVIANGQNIVTNAISGFQMFFRLSQ